MAKEPPSLTMKAELRNSTLVEASLKILKCDSLRIAKEHAQQLTDFQTALKMLEEAKRKSTALEQRSSALELRIIELQNKTTVRLRPLRQMDDLCSELGALHQKMQLAMQPAGATRPAFPARLQAKPAARAGLRLHAAATEEEVLDEHGGAHPSRQLAAPAPPRVFTFTGAAEAGAAQARDPIWSANREKARSELEGAVSACDLSCIKRLHSAGKAPDKAGLSPALEAELFRRCAHNIAEYNTLAQLLVPVLVYPLSERAHALHPEMAVFFANRDPCPLIDAVATPGKFSRGKPYSSHAS